MRYVLALGKMPAVIDQGHGVHDNEVNQILITRLVGRNRR